MDDIWTSRIVLKPQTTIINGKPYTVESMIVMPEQMWRVVFSGKWFAWYERENLMRNDFEDIARIDRATGLCDKNGKAIFENDRVHEGRWDGTVVFIKGAFMVRWDSGIETPIHGTAGCGEIIGLVPLEESHE